MTIPTLVKNYEKHVIEVGLKKTYTELLNVIKRSEIDNGPYEYWDYESGSVAFAEKYLTPYMGLKKCDKNSKEHCFNQKIDCCFPVWTVFGREEYGDGIYGMYRVAPRYSMPDGRSFSLLVGYDQQRNWRYVDFFVDVNGKRGKSVLGVDVFTFALFNYDYNGRPQRGFHPGRAQNSGEHSYSDSALAQYVRPDYESGQYAAAVILHRNGWKFPDNYPLKFWR